MFVLGCDGLAHRSESTVKLVVEQLTLIVRVSLLDHQVRSEVEHARWLKCQVVDSSSEAPSVELVLVGSEPSEDSDDSWVGRSPYTSSSHGMIFAA